MNEVSSTAGFEYSEEFRQMVVWLHRGKESWPQYPCYLNAHLGGPDSRLSELSTQLVRDLQHHCGELSGKRVLDFGCGTGATTAALAQVSGSVAAFDVDPESVGVARRRLREHGLARRARFFCAGSIDEIAEELGTLDVVLMNGVIEHIPKSIPGLREKVVRSAWGLLRPSGCLFINDTPNPLCPFDFHSTQLWWIPWTKPGSGWAYLYAVLRGRHRDSPTASAGPRGLEEVGAWGATYWEVLDYLRGEDVSCVNLEEGHDRRLSYAVHGSRRRQWIERALHPVAVKHLGVPITALTPSLTNLTLRKGSRKV